MPIHMIMRDYAYFRTVYLTHGSNQCVGTKTCRQWCSDRGEPSRAPGLPLITVKAMVETAGAGLNGLATHLYE